MNIHQSKFQPLSLFGKLAVALLLLHSITLAAEPTPAVLAGTATIKLKNSTTRQNLAGMDLILAPTSLIPEARRLRMETWRTEGLAIQRNAGGEEQPVGLRIDFADGYKYLDLKAMSQAAANAATTRARTETNGTFTFTNAPAGKQALYGQYKSRYAVAYWLLEVDLQPGRTNQIYLTESNAAEVFNRFEKPSSPSH